MRRLPEPEVRTRVARSGGLALFAKYGVAHMAAIGRKGGLLLAQRPGYMAWLGSRPKKPRKL